MMIGVLLIIVFLLTTILTFTYWLAVGIKTNKYLTSLAFYNTTLNIIFLVYLLIFYGYYGELTILLITTLLLHIISSIALIYYSWKKQDTIKK